MIPIIILFLFIILTLSTIKRYKVVFVKEGGSKEALYTRKTFELALSWIIPVIGAIGYILAYTDSFGDNADLKEVVIKVSDVFVIGGFIGFLSNSTQFFGVFREELEKIVFSDRFFEGRNNVPEVWRKASKALLNQKFPDISEELFTMIQDYYICKEEYSYYENYRIITDITWSEESKDYILVNDSISFTLVPEKEGKVDVPISTWMNGVKGLEKGKDYFCELECSVNGVKQNTHIDEKFQNNNNEYIVIHTVSINSKNKERYLISINRQRKYQFKLDYDISFRAKYIVKDMVISLNIPEDMKATFICRGTTKDFITVKNDEQRKEYLYKGLVLQRQGYIFALHKN